VNTGIDVLAIHDLLVPPQGLSPIAKVYSDVGLIVRENTVRVDYAADLRRSLATGSGAVRKIFMDGRSMWSLLASQQWRERLVYAAISLLLVWHTLAMVVASAPDSLMTRSVRPLLHPYLTLFRLDNHWGFFAPNVDPGVQFRYVIEDAGGKHHTFIPADKLSRFDPNSIWIRDRYRDVRESVDTFGDAAAAVLCREHASLHPVAITFLEVAQRDFSREDRLSGKHPLDPEFVDVHSLKTIQCADK
jgi:hypothetical protein